MYSLVDASPVMRGTAPESPTRPHPPRYRSISPTASDTAMDPFHSILSAGTPVGTCICDLEESMSLPNIRKSHRTRIILVAFGSDTRRRLYTRRWHVGRSPPRCLLHAAMRSRRRRAAFFILLIDDLYNTGIELTHSPPYGALTISSRSVYKRPRSIENSTIRWQLNDWPLASPHAVRTMHQVRCCTARRRETRSDSRVGRTGSTRISRRLLLRACFASHLFSVTVPSGQSAFVNVTAPMFADFAIDLSIIFLKPWKKRSLKGVASPKTLQGRYFDSVRSVTPSLLTPLSCWPLYDGPTYITHCGHA